MKYSQLVLQALGWVLFQSLSPIAMTGASQEELDRVESLIQQSRQSWERISPASFAVKLTRMMLATEPDEDPLYDTYHLQQMTRIDGERRLYQVHVEQDWLGRSTRKSSGTIIYDGSRYLTNIHGDGFFRMQEPSPLGKPEIFVMIFWLIYLQCIWLLTLGCMVLMY